MKLLLVLGVFVVGASGSCRNRCGEDSDYTCSCAARCSWFFQSTGCCDDYFAYCGVSYPIPSPDPTYFPTYHPPETPEHPTYYPPATEAPTYYPPQRCNNPGPIENGYISSDQHFFNIGDTVNYACKTGYQLKPAESRQRVCTSSYFISFLQTPYWTPEKPICEKTCPAPSFPTHGSYSPSGQTRFLAGKRITYTCSFGYKLEGSKVRKCLLSGRFSGFTSCKKILPCEKNPCDTNADCTNIGTDHFNCDCKDGYTGDGKTCSLTCPAPELPEHGSYSPAEQSRYNLGSNITYTCDIGYKLVGDKIQHCMRSGEFSGFARCRDCREINPCQDYTPCDPNAICTNIDNLRYTCDCKHGYVGDGKKCRKMCHCEPNTCHSMANCVCVSYNRVICICVQGYSGNGTFCESTCSVPPFPANGQYGPIQRTYPVGSKITYTCADGYRVVGYQTRECLEYGRFSGFATCEPIPTILPTPPPPSCKGKCGAYSFGSACACDPACINIGNCCHDYAQYCSAYVGR